MISSSICQRILFFKQLFVKELSPGAHYVKDVKVVQKFVTTIVSYISATDWVAIVYPRRAHVVVSLVKM
ncbi:hypothetical protein QL285_058170 [Trifolium repens]|nr:hypothetical protein QL285_058170 [Trifolium repens]